MVWYGMENGWKTQRRRRRQRLTHSPEFLGSLEAFVVRDGEDTEETLAAAKIIVSDGGVVLLTGRVQYIYLYFFAIQHNLRGFKVWVLDDLLD